jgi:hypothetical protein
MVIQNNLWSGLNASSIGVDSEAQDQTIGPNQYYVPGSGSVTINCGSTYDILMEPGANVPTACKTLSLHNTSLAPGNAAIFPDGITTTSCVGCGGGGTVNSAAANQLAYYASTGTAVSGTNALPAGTTAATQTAGDNTTKVATTAYVASPGAIAPTTVNTNGNISLVPATPGGSNRTLSWGNSYGVTAADLYDTGTGPQWGWGLNGGEMQFFGTSNSGDHISFNSSLTLGLKPSGTGEKMRLMLNTGDLLLGTTTDCGSLLCVNGAIAPTSVTAGIYAMPAEYSNGTCTTSKTIAPANGNIQNVTLTNGDTCALTFTQPSSGTFFITLKIIQSAVSSYNGTISGCKWPGGTVPTITATTGAVDFVNVYLDGTHAYCEATQNFQ